MKEFWNTLNDSVVLVTIAIIWFSIFIYINNRKKRKAKQKIWKECLNRTEEQKQYYSQFNLLMLFDKPMHLINKQSGLGLLKLNNCEFHLKETSPSSQLFSKGMVVEFAHSEIPNNDPDKAPQTWFQPKDNVKIDDAVVKAIIDDEVLLESKSLGSIIFYNSLYHGKVLHVGSQVILFQHVKKTPLGYLVFYSQHREI